MDIASICAQHYDAHLHDCSGFARAVAKAVGVELTGLANEIVDTLATESDGWERLDSGAAAAEAAKTRLVIGGLRGDEQAVPNQHGHVVVVVPGPLNRDKYPTAWWGSLAGKPDRDKTINWAWSVADRDKVVYAAHSVAV